jgi:transketolase
MRCFEQIRVNLALLSEVRALNVNLIGVGAGYSYVVSGPTHQCYEDLSLMRTLPNMHVMSPADEVASSAMAVHCIAHAGPKYVRLDAQVLPVLYEREGVDFTAGFHMHARGDAVCLVATGYMVHTALRVAARMAKDGVRIGVIDLFDLSAFSEVALATALEGYVGIVTMEEGFSGRGGLDALMFDWVNRRGAPVKIENIGVTGGYRFDLGDRELLHEKVGIGLDAVHARVRRFVRSFELPEYS